MFDIQGMRTLPEYCASAAPTRTHAEWAELFGISRSYFTDIINGKSLPGRDLIAEINKQTNGAVPPGVWFVDTP
ncbi:helix-turn-helix domain-containing protein [Pararhodobacter sp.]|uniref:helix-turn-helix domain-containing protein n=1 Tax=Pararhodobacter sp. TaxID=2127056 RepID=UPI002FDE1439